MASTRQTYVLEVARGRGSPQLLQVVAGSLESAQASARAQGFEVLGGAARETGIAGQVFGGGWRFGLSREGRRGHSAALRPGELAVFVGQLRDLLGAGLSVIEALLALRRGAAPAQALAIAQIEQSLQSGLPLSDALERDAGRYPALLVALVRAAERTSDLPQALDRYSAHEARVVELRHRVSSVATYPLLLMAVGVGVLAFLLLYVVPRFALVFDGLQAGNGQPLPWTARAIQAWADLLAAHGTGLALVFGMAFLLIVSVAMRASTRARVIRTLLNWGPLERGIRSYFLARWYRGTGLLVQGGIPLPEALQLSQALLPDGLRRGGEAVELAVTQGLGPAQAYTQAEMATPVAEQLLQAGERTGDLGGMLTRLADFHEAEFTRRLERQMRVLEPLVMVLIGLAVGMVVVMMYLPIFELASALQ